MGDLRDDLPEELRREIDGHMEKHLAEVFEEMNARQRQLSQHNFLSNAGGAVAVLAFIGANPDLIYCCALCLCGTDRGP